jgi:hypothetical protein
MVANLVLECLVKFAPTLLDERARFEVPIKIERVTFHRDPQNEDYDKREGDGLRSEDVLTLPTNEDRPLDIQRGDRLLIEGNKREPGAGPLDEPFIHLYRIDKVHVLSSEVEMSSGTPKVRTTYHFNSDRPFVHQLRGGAPLESAYTPR